MSAASEVMVPLSMCPGSGFVISTDADLDRYLAAVAAAGFPRVTLTQQSLAAFVDDSRWDYVANRIAAHGLQCRDGNALMLRRDSAAVLSEVREMLPMVAALGIEFVLTIFATGVRPESIDLLGTVSDLLATVGAKPSIEFSPGSPCKTLGMAADVVRELGADRSSILADTWHFSRGDSTWQQLESVPIEHIGIVQFDDALPAISADLMFETMDRRTWPGEGEFELGRYARTLLGRGWRGTVSTEVLSVDARALTVEEYARRSYESAAPYWKECPASAGV